MQADPVTRQELLLVLADCGWFLAMTSSDSTLEIRRAVHGDATAMMRVRSEAILAKAASHYDQTILQDWADAGDPARIAKNISDPDYVVLVAAAGGAMIGFAMAALSKRELQALYVKPNSVGRIGQGLLAELEKLAFASLPFLVCDASLNAEEFYRANGYAAECWKDRPSSSGAVFSRVVQMRKYRPHFE